MTEYVLVISSINTYCNRLHNAAIVVQSYIEKILEHKKLRPRNPEKEAKQV